MAVDSIFDGMTPMFALTSLAFYNTELTLRKIRCCGPISGLGTYNRSTSDTAFRHLHDHLIPKFEAWMHTWLSCVWNIDLELKEPT